MNNIEEPIAWYDPIEKCVFADGMFEPTEVRDRSIPLYTNQSGSIQIIEQLIHTLDRLARLGNGESYGNSIGNQIAYDAMVKAKKYIEETNEHKL